MFGLPNIEVKDNAILDRMAISLPIRLGRRLSNLRRKRGLNQAYLAEMAGIGRAHLSQIENGAVAAKIDTLEVLAQSLEVSLSELFRGL
jgi:transcriptional regulator with XRE-family HTH domain